MAKDSMQLLIEKMEKRKKASDEGLKKHKGSAYNIRAGTKIRKGKSL